MFPQLIPVAGALLIAFSPAPGPVMPKGSEPALWAERREAGARAGEELYALALSAFRDKLYGAAVGGFRRYLAQVPQGPHAPSARYLLGEAYRLSGKPKQALGAYQELIEKHPNSGFVDEARLRRGIFFFRASRFAEALRELEQVRSAEGRPRSLFWQGQSLLRLGRAREAAEAFSDFRALSPESPLARRARFYEAFARRRAGDREGAVQGFRAFLRKAKDPSLRARARWELAQALLEGRRWEEAGREIEILLREPSSKGTDRPGRGRLLLTLGQVRYREKKYPEAAARFGEALKERLGKEDRRLSLQGLAESSQAAGSHTKAARAFRELLSDGKVAPADPLWSKALRSHLAAGLCRPADASFIERIEQRASAHLGADGLYLLGRCLESMGGNRRAVAHYLRLEETHPRAPEAPWALFRAGKLLLAGGQSEEGLKRLLSFAERHPESSLAPRAILLAAQTLFRGKRYEEVLASLPPERVAPWGEPYGALAVRLRAEALLKLGRFREALGPLREMLSKGRPEQKARAEYLLGLAHYRLGQWREARRMWGGRMERFPPAVRQEALFLSLLAAVQEGAREETAILGRKVLGLPKLSPERRGRAAFELARALVELGKAGEAREVLGAALQNLSRGELDRAARLLLAGLLYERKEFAEVVPVLREWLARYEGKKGEARALLLLGQSEFERGKRREAAKLLERLLDRHPRVPEREKMLFQLGELYDDLGERERAVLRYRAYLDEVASSKRGAGVALRMGELLLEEGKVEEATRAWEQAAVRDAGSVSLQARYRLGELYLKRGEKERALAAFSAVARASVAGAESWKGAAALRAGALEEEKERWKEALAFYRLAAEADSGVEGEKARERVRRIEAYLKALKKARPKDGGKP